MKTSEQIAKTVFDMRDRQLAEREKKIKILRRAVPFGAAAVIAIAAGFVIAGSLGKGVETEGDYKVTDTVPLTLNETRGAVSGDGAPAPEMAAGEYGEETTVAATAPESRGQEGGIASQVTSGGTAVTTAIPNAGIGIPQTSRAPAETAADTTAPPPMPETAVEPHWDQLTMPERFPHFNLADDELNDYVYMGKELDAGRIGEKYTDATAKGYDVYTDKEYETTVHLYAIKGLSEDAVLAAKYDEADGYFVFKHVFGYTPDTLGQLCDDLDLLNTVSFGNIFIRQQYNGEGWLEYDPVPADSEKTDVLRKLFSEFRNCKCELKDEFREPNSFSVSTHIDLVGIDNRTLSFYDSGYMMTNIMEFGFYFCIGEDKVREIKELLGVNDAQPHFIPDRRESSEGNEITSPAHLPGDAVAEVPADTAVMTSPDIIYYTTSEQ